MKTLAQYLHDKKLTQAAFAERVGVKQPTISRLVEGVKGPGPALAKKIEDETGGEVPFHVWPAYAVLVSDSDPTGVQQ